MRIAVTGLGAVSAFGWGAGRLYDGLLRGETAAAPLEVFDADGYRTRLAAQVPPGGPPDPARVRTARPHRRTPDGASGLHNDLRSFAVFF